MTHEEEIRDTRKVKFGDIYTNGINYWMVVAVHEDTCNNPAHNIFNGEELRPVVVDENENPKYFVGYYQGGISSIRSHARFVKSLLSSGGNEK